VIVIAAIVILAGVVVVAMGRGGELARDRPAEPATGFRTWYDVAAYRPPGALLGYDPAATQHALREIARAIADRDAEIDQLRRKLAATGRPADPMWQTALDPADQGPAE
jgi:hypothetical protein